MMMAYDGYAIKALKMWGNGRMTISKSGQHEQFASDF
jgi:hypothetical protein